MTLRRVSSFVAPLFAQQRWTLAHFEKRTSFSVQGTSVEGCRDVHRRSCKITLFEDYNRYYVVDGMVL